MPRDPHTLAKHGQVFLDAADVLAERGHCFGCFGFEESGPVCLYTALCMAGGQQMERARMGTRMALFPSRETDAFVGSVAPGLGLSDSLEVCNFNNSHETDELVAWLREKAYAV